MGDDFDPNKIASDLIVQSMKELLDFGTGIFKNAKDSFHIKLRTTYEKYLEVAFKKYSQSRSFFFRSESPYLYDYYVPICLKRKKEIINNPTLSTITKINQYVIITGNGGCGKSTLIKHLFLSSLVDKFKIPVLVELREYNDSKYSLFDLICDCLTLKKELFDKSYIQKALNCGHFALMFDGYDEVKHGRKGALRREIEDLTKKYDKNTILVSSRPALELSSWKDFTILETCPLTKFQACQLVNKLPYDTEIKRKFISELNNDLFQKHISFLSNPLLLTIMLLTYSKSADIPSKLNVFYNQAYETLYQSHDALKGAYQREKLSGLDIQDFSKVFSCFCLQTYDKRNFSFSQTQALNYIENSKRITGLKFKSEDFLYDALQAVCLLVEDGLFITFAHRSFQEYFVSRFIFESKPELQEKLLNKYVKNFNSDYVIKLLWEINPHIVEKYVFLPKIDELEKIIGLKKKVGITHYLKYVTLFFSKFDFESGELLASTKDEANILDGVVTFMVRNYGHLIGFVDYNFEGQKPELLDKKFGGENSSVYLTKNAKIHDPFFRLLAEHGKFFSMRSLEIIFEIKLEIKNSHKKLDVSIDDLLSL